MKKLISFVMVLSAFMLVATDASARNTRYLLPIATAMSPDATQGILDGSVKFYFGNQHHPKVLQDLGTFVSNPKTNSFGKPDLNACNWAFLSAMKNLQGRAHKVGANAIINIVSYYDKNEIPNANQFECHAGGFVAGVALKGDFVKVAGR